MGYLTNNFEELDLDLDQKQLGMLQTHIATLKRKLGGGVPKNEVIVSLDGDAGKVFNGKSQKESCGPDHKDDIRDAKWVNVARKTLVLLRVCN